jgi:hypothetical protein
MTLIAKPIIKDQYWIVTDGKEKVGNIIIKNDTINFNIDNTISSYDNIKTIESKYNINFESDVKSKNKCNTIYKDYPVDSDMFNIIVDIKKKIQLYTKTPDSKCYYVSGYFNINIDNNWDTYFCPKYIYIQRYPYMGPYKTLGESKKILEQV